MSTHNNAISSTPKRFYSIVGYNGVLIADNLPQVKAALRYIKKPEILEFDNFQDAETHALIVFNDQLDSNYYHLHYLTVNHAIYKKNILRSY